MKILKIAKWLGITIAGALVALSVLIYSTSFHPAETQDESFVSPVSAPVLKPGSKIKVLSWNIQYMAGKNYVFFYDLLAGDGPDERPTAKDIVMTRGEIVRIIKNENPDIILIQEIDEGSKRTDYENQLGKLLAELPKSYSSYTSTFYHKGAYVPHPRIKGSVGLKLATISKYRIAKAIRHQLPVIPDNILVKQFNFKRCILEARMPVDGGKDLSVFNTHFDAFAQGSDTMKKQAAYAMALFEKTTPGVSGWLIGGDFNLLPPGQSYGRLPAPQRAYFNEKTELAPLFEKYRSVPSLAEINGPGYLRWLSHFPNDPAVKAPDRTIDFMFLSDSVTLLEHYIRQGETWMISDHLPLVAEIIVPLKKQGRSRPCASH